MKTNVMMFFISLAIVGCGRGGLDVRDPTNVDPEFRSPSGELTAINATDAINRFLAVLNAERIATGEIYVIPWPKSNEPIPTPLDQCITRTADQKEETVDVKCVSDQGFLKVADYLSGEVLDTCTGFGTVTATSGDVRDTFSFDSNSLNCPAVPFSFNNAGGAIVFGEQHETPNYIYSCLNMTFSIEGHQASADGCGVSKSSIEMPYDVLVDGGNGPVIVGRGSGGGAIDASCSTLCVQVTDKNGASKVSCNVTQKTTGCSPSKNTITEVADCVATRDGACG
ncbi:MAG: hypothetical protein V1495_06550 [Pseudomonadota bacterium]